MRKLNLGYTPLFAAGALLLAAGCAHQGEDNIGAATTASAAPAGTQNELSDGEISALLQAMNQGAIAEAELAMSQARSADVRNLANTIIGDRATSNAQLMALVQKGNITITENDRSRDCTAQANDRLKSLREKKGNDFDKAYVDAVIAQSKKALEAIDTKLLPNAKNADLAQHIRDLRPRIAQHLMQAQQIQPAIAQN